VRKGGKGTISVKVGTAVSGQQAVDELRQELRPIAFAAAYKILDLLVEGVLRANGASRRLTFATKVQRLKARPASLPAPLDQHGGYWDRLAVLYASLNEVRHALIHRRAGWVGGVMEAYDDSGNLIDTITKDEAAAFIAGVHAVAELVTDGSADERRLFLAATQINALQQRHALGLLPVAPLGLVVRKAVVALDATEAGWRLDLAELKRTVDGQQPSFWDIEALAGPHVLEGRWEDVPDINVATVEFPIAAPPSWLRERLNQE
jgi:hypothetical protein